MKILVFVICFLPAWAFSQKLLTIEGKLDGLPDKSPAFVTDATTGKPDTFARGQVNKGVLQVKGSMREALLVNLEFPSVKKKIALFLDNGTLTVNGNIDQIQKIQFSGIPVEADFQVLQTTFNPLFEEYSKLGALVRSGTGNRDSVQLAGGRTFASIQEKTDQFIDRHAASPVSAFLLIIVTQMSEDMDVAEKRFVRLDNTAKTSYFGKYIGAGIAKAKVGAVGSDAIEFTQTDVNGKAVSLSSFKGKYVLIDFWASWCGPCRMENPNVLRNYEQFKGKNFTIVGVSLDKAKDAWIKAISDDKLSWTQVSDLKFWSNEVAVKYNIQSIPQNFLVDPNGKIVAKNLRGDALHNKLCELLGCN